ncbi:MAG TPA: hypothetical protein VMH89_07730 [Candidatus Acidoferrum sp.]|nr:hypothetical protein [Candidatus Acidoferrum sp.]
MFLRTVGECVEESFVWRTRKKQVGRRAAKDSFNQGWSDPVWFVARGGLFRALVFWKSSFDVAVCAA